ncbi:MAG: efflux RND transporter periplasmic adaptor subunit [Betaproteobacteria bacterium]|nr:efflux RND transporter periplasmic adaptor subunit [Betaproteobacteria bacterium]
MNRPEPPARPDISATLDLGRVAAVARRRWRRAALAAVLIALAALAWLLFVRDGNPVRYRTAPAQRGSLAVTVTATGTLQPTNQVDVGSELSGTIRSVEVDYNDPVTVGQVLARLDTVKLEAQAAQSRAALAAAGSRVRELEATVAETRREFERTGALHARNAVSDRDLVAAESAFKRADAALESARSQVSQALATVELDRTNLAKAVIRSPVKGMVLARKVEPGQTVAATLQAPVLFQLAEDLARMELRVDVDEADVGQVQPGQGATFTVDAYPDQRFPSAIREVRYAPKTVGGVVTYEAVLTVDNDRLLLRPGMTATADITVRQVDDALLVPNAALRFSPALRPEAATGGGSFTSKLLPHRPPPPRTAPEDARRRAQRVWVLRDAQPVEIPVKTGASDGRMTEIRGGDVEPGMELVVEAAGATK